MMNEKVLVIIDGSSLTFRGYYAFSNMPLRNSKGVNTSAPFVFLSTIENLKEMLKPSYMVVVFDAPKKTFRHKVYQNYKAQRKKAPDELKQQIEIIKKLLKALNIKYLEIEGVEADDVIASLVQKFAKNGLKIYILTGDKDMFQLISDTVFVITGTGKDMKIYDKETVLTKFGVPPVYIPDLLALTGDSIDNIKGVKGIGKKTAKELINRFGAIEDIYSHLDDLKATVKIKLEKGREDAFFSKQLVLLKKDVEIDAELDNFSLNKPDLKLLVPVLKELEFHSFLKKYLPPAPELKIKEYSYIPMELLGENKLFFAIDKNGKTFVYHNNRILSVPFHLFAPLLEQDSEKFTWDAKKIEKELLKIERGTLKNLKLDFKILKYLLEPEKGEPAINRFFTEELGFSPPAGKELEYLPYGMFKSYEKGFEQLKKEGLLKLFNEIELPLIKVLAYMEHRGVLVDTSALEKLEEELKDKIAGLIREMTVIAGKPINFNSSRQLQEILFGKLGLKPIKRTKTGYSTDQETLEKLKDQHEFVKLLLKYRELTKIYNTYIKGFKRFIGPDSRIHPVFHQTGTATGRLSCSDPNLQNLPIRSEIGREIRRLIKAPKDYKIASFDYSQIELRIAAYLSKEERLIEAFEQNRDIHTETATKLFNKPFDEITPEERRIAKTVNFGILYGISPYGLMKELNITKEEAESLIQNFYASYPALHRWIMEKIKEAKEKGEVRTLFGRKRRIPEINSTNQKIQEFGYRLAINTPVQGTAADIIKKAMVEIFKELKDDAFMILQIHDELVFEIPEELITEIPERIKEIMENVVEFRPKLKVEYGIGNNWLEAHS